MGSGRKVVVLGAGFSGLWVSLKLLEQGFEVELIEQAARPGGLMETITRDGFLLDLGPHILLASHQDHYRSILGKDLLRVQGYYGFGYRGKQILSPLTPVNLLQNLGPIRALPLAASMAWHRLPFTPPRPPWDNVDALLTAKFGEPVNQAFFRYYIPKVTGCSATEVSVDWFLERYRFYREHSLGRQLARKGWQSLRRFLLSRSEQSSDGLELYYPRQGAQMLTDAIFSRISENGANMRLGAKVTRIQARNERVKSVAFETGDGKSGKAEGDLFVSTLPLTHLASLFGGDIGSDFENAAKELAWRHLWLFYIAAECDRVSEKIQIYFTEKRYPFKRIYEPKNLIPTMGSPGITNLCVEICYSDGDPIDRSDEGPILQSVLKGLSAFYGLSAGQLHFVCSRRVPHSYAIYRSGYNRPLKQMAASLFPLSNFISYGRQGSFRYNHLVDRIIDASERVMDYICEETDKESFMKEPSAKSDFF